MHSVKVCPQCGQDVFDDMDVCFECLYQFPRRKPSVAKGGEGRGGPTAPCLRIATSLLDVTLPVSEEGLVVGRGSTADVVLHDPMVSRRHVRIDPCEDGMQVTDLGARNKALIGGREVDGTCVLHEGDVLLICDTMFALDP